MLRAEPQYCSSLGGALMTLKLYFSPGACSLSPHIIAREAQLDIKLDKVDFATKKTASGQDYLAINPKGYVPALELENGYVLTENPAIAQYLADQKPAAKLAPAHGTLERYKLEETLAYINSEIHKSYSPLFNPKISPEQRQDRIDYLHKRYSIVEKALSDRPYLFGENFSAADAYLFVVTRWAGMLKVDLSKFKALTAFQERVGQRPAVKAAIEAETAYKA
jgi:glutathione S-transferase